MRHYVVAVAAVLFLLLVTACGGSTPEDDVAEERVVVAAAPNLTRTSVDIAIDQGYFREEGIEIEHQPSAHAPQQVPLLASGQVDVTLTGPGAAHLNAFSADIPVQMVADCASSSPDGELGSLYLVVHKELYDSGAVTSVADLAGKRIAVPSRETKGFVDVVALLEAEGMTVDDVEIVAPLGFPEQLAGLTEGSIDAGMTIEPFIMLGEEQEVSVLLAGDHDIMPLRHGCGVFYGSRMFEDRELGLRWMRAYIRGARDYHDAMFKGENRDEMIDFLARTYETDPGTLDRAIPRYWSPDGAINPESLELDYRVFSDHGLLTAEFDVDDFIDTSFVEQVVSELGPYDG